MGLAAFLVAAGAVFFGAPLVLDGSPGGDAMPTLTVEPDESSAAVPDSRESPDGEDPAEPSASQVPASSGSPAADSGEGTLTALPKKVCDSVSKATFLALVPKGEAEEYGGTRAGSCGYTGGSGADFRYLRLETRLGETTGDLDPISVTKWSFDQDYEQQKEDKITKTLVLEKVPGLGEDAFKRVFSDAGEQNVTTARVEVRVRNVIITVNYSRPFKKEPKEQEKSCLDGAMRVAEEALRSYS